MSDVDQERDLGFFCFFFDAKDFFFRVRRIRLDSFLDLFRCAFLVRSCD